MYAASSLFLLLFIYLGVKFFFHQFKMKWLMWQRSGVLNGLALMMFTRIVRDQGSIPPLRHRIFQITNCHLLDHCYIWWPIGHTVIFGGQCDLQVQNTWVHAFSFEGWVWQQSGVLGGLAVMMLTSDSAKPGFDSLRRHRIFGITPSTNCYIKTTKYLNTRFVTNLSGKQYYPSIALLKLIKYILMYLWHEIN